MCEGSDVSGAAVDIDGGSKEPHSAPPAAASTPPLAAAAESDEGLTEVAAAVACTVHLGLRGCFQEIVVPPSYCTTTGSKFKARALQYAIDVSAAQEEDWVVHLDEETRFDVDTVRHCLSHCVAEDRDIASGSKRYGNIGQGPILYGRHEIIENYVNTLADRLV